MSAIVASYHSYSSTAVVLVGEGEAVKTVTFFYNVMERTPFGDKFEFHLQ